MCVSADKYIKEYKIKTPKGKTGLALDMIKTVCDKAIYAGEEMKYQYQFIITANSYRDGEKVGHMVFESLSESGFLECGALQEISKIHKLKRPNDEMTDINIIRFEA